MKNKITLSNELVKAIIYAFNAIPNTRINNEVFPNTYAIAAALRKETQPKEHTRKRLSLQFVDTLKATLEQGQTAYFKEEDGTETARQLVTKYAGRLVFDGWTLLPWQFARIAIAGNVRMFNAGERVTEFDNVIKKYLHK